MPEILLNALLAVILTMPATDKPVTYAATSGTTVLGYSEIAGWVPFETCFNRCFTTPGQRVRLLNGELSFADMAALEITIWRQVQGEAKPVPIMWFTDKFFQPGPQVWGATVQKAEQ